MTKEPELKECNLAIKTKEEWHQDIQEKQQKTVLQLCPVCGYPVTEYKKDTKGNQWFICGKQSCKSTTQQPLTKEYTPFMSVGVNCYSTGEEGNTKFDIGKYTVELMSNYFFKTDIKTGVTYIYNLNNCIWEDTAEVFIQMKMAETLGGELREHQFKEVFFQVKANTYEDLHEPLNKITVGNGTLNLETFMLEDSTPGNFITSRLEWNFDPEAKCPEINKFLIEVFTEKYVDSVLEFIGYCLLKSYPIQKILLLLGEGANGKSVFLKMVQHFLGRENCANIPLQQLCYDKFSAANLKGKLANICADLSATEIKQLGPIKMLTGDDYVHAQHKFQKPFEFLNTAKMIYSANRAPTISEDTDAVFRRLFLIPCNTVFIEGVNADPNILKKITTPAEMEGLLIKIVEALQTLLKNGRLSNTENIEETRKKYLRQMNSAKSFIEENIEQSDNDNDYIPNLYELYIEYCKKESLSTMPQRTFTENLKQIYPKAERVQKRILGKRVWVYAYLKICEQLKEETEELTDEPQQTLLSSVKKDDTVTTVTTHISGQTKRESNSNIVCGAVTVVTPKNHENQHQQDAVTTTINNVEVPGYTQLVCYFCGKGIMDNDWVTNEYTENKPAHKKCFMEKQKELKTK
jgi:putative DNA primase/helicase